MYSFQNHHSYLNFLSYRGVTECTQPVEVVSYKIGVCKVSPSGKECRTEFERLNYNGRSSVVLCRPFTGRMHQIRVHLQYLGTNNILTSTNDLPLMNLEGNTTNFSLEKIWKEGVNLDRIICWYLACQWPGFFLFFSFAR